jgi:iron complex outermembrane receptor protein
MYKKLLLTLFASFGMMIFLNAQTKISGTVKDSNGEPLIGASVQVDGTSEGTTTDLEGDFTIMVSDVSGSLNVSYTGYTSILIPINGRNTIDVILEAGVSLDEIVLVGSRSYNRSATDSPAPIDVIDISELATSNGRVEMNQILQYAAPSFNATKQSGSDGADHIDPASLRGMGPDQTLVLINGKRRHQSSLVNIFGTRGRGNSGTDLNAIPVSAIKRIEVLRDGASAQYGSDAIAGVINIVLKDQTDGLEAFVSYGMHSTAVGEEYAEEVFEDQDGWEPALFNIEGTNRIDGEDRSFDGNTSKIGLNYGTKLNDKGAFINVTAEGMMKDRTLRPSFEWRQGYGSAAVDQYQGLLNAAFPVGNGEVYVFGDYVNRYTDAYAFSRGAAADDSRSNSALYPDGFSPRITSKIIDNSATVGYQTVLSSGWNVDLSHTYGMNNFQYTIKGTNNASMGSMGANAPTEFDAGGHSLSMNNSALGVSKYNESIANGLNMAFGAEFRSENFTIFEGEEGSYSTYDASGNVITDPASQVAYTNEFGEVPSGGSQGFPGYSPANVVNASRSNVGAYADFELNATEQFLLTAALRFENYSDFGNTFNYKLGARYKVSDAFSVRSTYSTGFRAPSLAQVHYNLVFNNIVAGTSVRTLLASNTSDIARNFGIDELKQEEASNFAAGFTLKKGGFTATIDGYMINVTDRIILTDYFDASGVASDVSDVQFFANGVDTRTTGLDIVLRYKHWLTDDNNITAGIAANFNNTEIEAINSGSLNEYTFFGPFSQAYLEAAAPDYKIGVNAGLKMGDLSINLAYTLFSEVLIQDFQWVDSPATNAEEAAALLAVATDIYEQAGTLDIGVNWSVTDRMDISLGANNLLNTYPTPQWDGWTDQGGFNDSVQMGSDGAFFFSRLSFKF